MKRRKLTDEERAERARQRMIETVVKRGAQKYRDKILAPLFQRMIRAEAAAKLPRNACAVIDGDLRWVFRTIGQCVCITCGKVLPWSGGLGGMHTGHFLASRRNSILFEEDNVAPQCSYCNRYQDGAPQRFRLWMEAVRGPEVIERLEQLKTTTRQFTREELVDMRIEFAARLKAAEERMRG
jgi:hypothetical protein